MDKIIIRRFKRMPIVIKGLQQTPIPWDFVASFTGEFQLVFSLQSTSGDGAQWEFVHGKDEQEEFLTWGRYNPTFVGVVENPTILWVRQKSKHNFSDIISGIVEEKKYYIIQDYKEGFDPFIGKIVVAGTNLTVLPLRKKMYERAKHLLDGTAHSLCHITQGHLEIFSIKEVEEKEIPVPDYSWKEILNHQLVGGRIIEKFRVSETLCALVEYKKNGWVVSPDHLEEPCSMNRGLYLLTHPEPVTGVD